MEDTDDVTGQMTDHPTDQVPDQASDQVSDQTGDQVSDQTGDQASDPMSAQMHALTDAVLEIEAFVDQAGWDQPTRLFALADSATLVQREPALAAQLGIDPGLTPLTSVEQEEFDVLSPLDEALAQLAWRPEVIGAVLVVERLMLPPEAEAGLPSTGDAGELARAAAAHPDAQDVRIIGAVLRDGTHVAALRPRHGDGSGELMFSETLAPALTDALAATFLD